MLAVDLPSDIEKRIEDLAEKAGISKDEFAREAILAHLEDLEDAYLAQKAWKRAGNAFLSRRSSKNIAWEKPSSPC